MSASVAAAFVGFFGVLIGGLLNYFFNLRLRRQELELGFIRQSVEEKTRIYSDFLVSAQRMLARSLGGSKVNQGHELEFLFKEYALVEMRGSEKVVSAAVKIADFVLTAHTRNENNESVDFFSLKKQFILAVREEMSTLKGVKKES